MSRITFVLACCVCCLAAGGTAQAATKRAGVAKPGTTLSYGQSAVAPYTSNGTKVDGKVRVTILSVTHAKPGDFKNVQLNAAQNPADMYYVKYSITNLGTTNLNDKLGGPSVAGIDRTGQDGETLSVIGTFKACAFHQLPKPWSHGKTWTSCDIYDAPGGIKKVTYDGGVLRYLEVPITWR